MMKTLLKSLSLLFAINIISLSFTLSFAASDVLYFLNKKAKPYTTFVIFPQALPQGESNRINNPFYALEGVLVKPILAHTLSPLTLDQDQNKHTKTKNQFFEMATIFNDNLQYFLAKFSSSPSLKLQPESQPIPKLVPQIKPLTKSSTTSKCKNS